MADGNYGDFDAKKAVINCHAFCARAILLIRIIFFCVFCIIFDNVFGHIVKHKESIC